MTEPVAYIRKTSGGTYISQTPIGDNYGSKTDKTLPLYTKEQLQPRVKMTQKQYDRLMWDKSHTNLLACIDYFFEHDDNYKLGLPSENLRGNLTQEDIARAWLNPEETIEIVPDMKWFVRSKKSDINGHGWLSIIDKYQTPVYQYNNDKPLSSFVSFDTKEEAELWTNPLTEAVQLPVDGE